MLLNTILKQKQWYINSNEHAQVLVICYYVYPCCLQSSEDFDAGSTLLWLLEDFALNNHNASHTRVESNNISKNVHNIDIILLQTN